MVLPRNIQLGLRTRSTYLSQERMQCLTIVVCSTCICTSSVHANMLQPWATHATWRNWYSQWVYFNGKDMNRSILSFNNAYAVRGWVLPQRVLQCHATSSIIACSCRTRVTGNDVQEADLHERALPTQYIIAHTATLQSLPVAWRYLNWLAVFDTRYFMSGPQIFESLDNATTASACATERLAQVAHHRDIGQVGLHLSPGAQASRATEESTVGLAIRRPRTGRSPVRLLIPCRHRVLPSAPSPLLQATLRYYRGFAIYIFILEIEMNLCVTRLRAGTSLFNTISRVYHTSHKFHFPPIG